VADFEKINFTGDVRIGDVLLPLGPYEVRHVMRGENHLLVFRKQGSGKPVEARVKCTLAPVTEKATRSEKAYELNAANEPMLPLIVFLRRYGRAQVRRDSSGEISRNPRTERNLSPTTRAHCGARDFPTCQVQATLYHRQGVPLEEAVYNPTIYGYKCGPA
jgi:hypothetical protein